MPSCACRRMEWFILIISPFDRLRRTKELTMSQIFLLGFMGCGKSFFAERLAEEFNVELIDMDSRIEKREKSSVSDIFEKKGEAHFRKLERFFLESFEKESKKNKIISCGGGTPCFSDNIEFINKIGVSVYIKTPIDTLFERLILQRETRPLIKNLKDEELKTFITEKLKEREKFYDRSTIKFHYDQQTFAELKKVLTPYLL